MATSVAWVFSRSEGTWSLEGPKLTATGEVGEGEFGVAVALSSDGNTALISGYVDDKGIGAAWEFKHSESWVQEGLKLKAGEEVGEARFGSGVALDGNGETGIIGALSDNTNDGAAWIFTYGFTIEESFGPENEGEPNLHRPCAGHPVNCATGNQIETQTDLAVGGRGPGLHLTRTYNSQLAAQQTARGVESGSFGYGWTGSYSAHLEVDEAVEMATVYQDNGSVVRFHLTQSKTYIGAGPWVQATLVKTGGTYVYTLPDQSKLDFDSAGQLSSETDRYGNSITMSYSSEGVLESVTDGDGRKLTFAYNEAGLVESVKDPMGHTVKYTYPEGERVLATVTEPGEASPRWKFEYDPSNQMTAETDGRGNMVTTEYDSSDRAVSQTDGMQRKRQWEYSPIEAGTSTTVTEPNGSVTVEQFDNMGLPTTITHASGTALAATTSYGYDVSNDLITVTDPNKHTVRYGYDVAGDRTSLMDANGNQTKWTYDGTHDLETVTTPKGEKTTIKRNIHGDPEVIERSAPGGKVQKTSYTYDGDGDLTSETDPLGRIRTYGYDAAGDRESETDPEGDERTWTYNGDSQEVSMVSPRGNVKGAEASKYTTKTERDEQGRPLIVTDPLGHTTKYTYDGNGNLETLTDGDEHKTTYAYNADDQLTAVKEPNSTVTETEYDSDGQVIIQTDGNKHSTKYGRNLLGQVIEEADPLGHTTTKEYDSAGNLKKLTDPEKRTTTYTYDPGNRLITVSYSGVKMAGVKYEYDKDSNIVSMADGTGKSTYTFDQLDRLTHTANGHGESVSFEYDLANEQTKLTYPNKDMVTHSYDKDGRLQTVSDWLGHQIKMSYDPDSDLTAIAFPTTTNDQDKYAYDDAGRMSEVKMTKGTETLASLAYARDGDGQLMKTTSRGLPGEEVTEYTYDENNRLAKAGGTIYEYDAANNPKKIGTASYTYNSADELETGAGAIYAYNELGQRTERAPGGAAMTYGYDQAGNLISAERAAEGKVPAISDTYAYDGNGLRASQTKGKTTSYLTWDVAEDPPLLLNDGTNSYIYGPGDVPIEQINGESKVLYLHHDQQGSIRMLTGSTGSSEGAMTYDPYGNTTGTTGTATTSLGYDGQYTNTDTGLIYLRARAYDPATAQFLTADPLKAITEAPYDYAGDNPLNRADPTGLGNWLDLGIPSPGEVLSALNPIKYYEEEINAYENGCSYWQSIQHGFVGAGVASLDATGIAALARGVAALLAEEEVGEIKISEGAIGHIFRDAEGHLLEDTPENRALIEGAVRPGNFVAFREPGVAIFRETLPDGTEIWAEVYNGSITNGGLNQVPR